MPRGDFRSVGKNSAFPTSYAGMMSLTIGMLMQRIVKRVLLDNAGRDVILGLFRESNPYKGASARPLKSCSIVRRRSFHAP